MNAATCDQGAAGALDLFERIAEDKRARVIDSAITEFAEYGYQNANVNRIALAAGISVGALYKYFATKDALFLYIVQEAAGRISEQIEAVLALDIRFFSKLEKLLRLARSYSLEDPAYIKLYNVFTSENNIAQARALSERIEGVSAEAYRGMIAQAQEKGEVRRDIDAGILAVMLDNQLMATQFSFACAYYKRRFELYVGQGDAADDEYVINSVMSVLKGMFQP